MSRALTLADVQAMRAKTPGCAQVVHFNHAGASLPSAATLDAITSQLRLEAQSGPMEASMQGTQAAESARANAAALFNATPAEIAFTSSGSAGWGMAFAALGRWQAGDRILVGRHEWAGNLATMHHVVDAAGAHIETIPCEDDGTVSVRALDNMIDSRVRLIALTWVPANGGVINPAEAIGDIARRHGIPYFIDAGQALGQMRIDVQALNCDVLKGAARKFLRGPRGTALLYVKQSSLKRFAPPYVDVLSAPFAGDTFSIRDDARRFETSEVSTALLCGLSNALAEAREIGIDRIENWVRPLARNLRERLAAIPGVVVRDLGHAHAALVSFTVDGIAAAEVKSELASRGINVGANGVAYTPLDMQARGLTDIVRASISYLNVPGEIDILVDAVAEIAASSAQRIDGVRECIS
ncbi:aminotransferase class V-fold PLP-dependent enzyme [Paraburkholderia antibiotica]|uniref:Aminotransferase class V-fold PLP-dependent enzyme n=1 Tax=Paraburkholderia antibiotica TaxID=2728839 RepID=A0A7X9X8W0_9BURK|nr:aminotransferase class V-fold PLP-dependent enzyme [Paraburkholderia antibiotica]NML33057.1 aminotransferase class V-fold PLP-dependent enzyme [Paraburkholderia antibiotica]